MDESQYTSLHAHPLGSHQVEVVAYERHDGTWDAFVFEPPGTCPELERNRVDDEHIFVARLASADDLEHLADEIDIRLGAAYSCAVYYRETGSRRIIGQIHSHLKQRGAQKMWVRSTGPDDWELVLRRKDFAMALEIIESNVKA